MSARLGASAATLAGYVVLVVWLTWPLGAHLTTRFPGLSRISRMDTLHSLWVLSWEAHALATAPASVLDAPIYVPAPHALLYSSPGVATLPYFAPTFLLTGNPVLAGNLAFLACVALGAWGLHRVVAGWTGSGPGGVVAACTFLLTPWVLWTWTPARPIHAPLQYFPWIIALVALPGSTRGRTLALGALIALQGMTDPIYVAPAVVAPIVAVALARLLRGERRPAWSLVCAVALGLAVLAPLYAAYAVVRAENPSLFRQSAWATAVEEPRPSAVDGIVLAGGVWPGLRPTGTPAIVVPLIALGFALRARRPRGGSTRAAWRHAGLFAAIGIAISTRALIVPADPPRMLPSPLFTLLDAIAPQIGGMLRGTVRLGVGALFGIALLAGLAFVECERRLARPGAAWLAAATLVVAMYVGWPGRTGPYPLDEPPQTPTPILEALRGSDGPLLELPASTAPLATTHHAEAMYRSIFHWRPLVNGYGSYWPAGFAERMALVARLPDPDAWYALRHETGVASVLVHAGTPRYGEWLRTAGRDDGPLHLVVRADEDLLFAARP